ncbi:hypothetical protein LEP1GSC108_2998 [Leptospira weilii str. UI 13098]|uniref:Uncharacterized protein n=1 Tax=Leptospira weilii str. UI 13098 TaxID=1088542 RepID=M6QND8_9LEPT|nr:hypothetical protein LEP1GSC108_2998 [Leptospira weilii str. UI 13098]
MRCRLKRKARSNGGTVPDSPFEITKKKPEDSFEYSGFRVVRRFITGIINPF